MDQRIRLFTAAAVMLIGLGFALLFRHPLTDKDAPVPLQSDPLVLRKLPDPQTLAGGETPPAATQPRPLPAAAEPRPPAPTGATPIDLPTPPPQLPKTYPEAVPASGQTADTRWGASLGEMVPESLSAPPTHKIVDGDSLALLAQRYLGSASRAMEIYEANRDVLQQPEILPIGAELKIPRADQAARKP